MAVPTVVVTAGGPQTVGSSLTLTCSIEAVQGVITMANIVWTTGALRVVRRTDGVTLGNMTVFTDTYTISQLSTSDDSTRYRCEVVVLNTDPPVTASGIITLDLMSKWLLLKLLSISIMSLFSSCSSSLQCCYIIRPCVRISYGW